MKFDVPISIVDHIAFTKSTMQPLKHVVKFVLPPNVILQKFKPYKSGDFIAFQFEIGRTTKRVEIEMPK